MKIKDEKGAVGTDIALSVLVITIFITLIGTMVVNINLNSTKSERKSIATSYAVQAIERIKSEGYISEYDGLGTTEQEVLNGSDNDIEENGEFTGYHEKLLIEDYVILDEANSGEKQNILKKITAEISYKAGGKDQVVQLSTYVTK